MKHIVTGGHRAKFEVLFQTAAAQAAMMTLAPGAVSEAEPGNEHPRCEQWLFVISGSGQATVGKRRGALHRVRLRQNSLLVIEKGELHQIKNTGRRSLRTINFYIPPAYKENGEPRQSATAR